MESPHSLRKRDTLPHRASDVAALGPDLVGSLAPGRTLIEGPAEFKLLGGNGLEPCHLFLCNDVLIYGLPRHEKDGRVASYASQAVVPLAQCDVNDMSASMLGHGLQLIVANTYSIELFAEQAAIKDAWLLKIYNQCLSQRARSGSTVDMVARKKKMAGVMIPLDSVHACMSCDAPFTTARLCGIVAHTRRRAHCKHCGLVACETCVVATADLRYLGMTRSEHVCPPCLKITKMRQHIQSMPESDRNYLLLSPKEREAIFTEIRSAMLPTGQLSGRLLDAILRPHGLAYNGPASLSPASMDEILMAVGDADSAKWRELESLRDSSNKELESLRDSSTKEPGSADLDLSYSDAASMADMARRLNSIKSTLTMSRHRRRNAPQKEAIEAQLINHEILDVDEPSPTGGIYDNMERNGEIAQGLADSDDDDDGATGPAISEKEILRQLSEKSQSGPDRSRGTEQHSSDRRANKEKFVPRPSQDYLATGGDDAITETTPAASYLFSIPLDDYAALVPPQEAFDVTDDCVMSVGSMTGYTVEEIAREIVASLDSRSKVHIARGIFRWVAERVMYRCGAVGDDDEDSRPDDVLRLRSALSSGYSVLYKALCMAAGVHCFLITGFSNRSTDSRHRWNAVELEDGHFALVDVTWASGYVHQGNFYKRFNGFYFGTNPRHFAFTHLPDHPEWQLLSVPISRPQFESLPVVTSDGFRLGLQTSSHHLKTLSANGKGFLKVSYYLPTKVLQSGETTFNSRLSVKLGAVDDKSMKVETSTFTQIEGGLLVVRARAPYAGTFRLRLYGSDTKTHHLKQLLEQDIVVERVDRIGLGVQFPYQFGLPPGRQPPALIAPMRRALKQLSLISFAVDAPGATSAFITLNSNMAPAEMTYLARQGDGSQYRGEVLLRNIGKALLAVRYADSRSVVSVVSFDVI
eukprot:m.257941 g.257941  ORF g.257941 m.257941 type:complete len:923 (-) comp21202_c0_seq1:190-2958(-)